MSDAALQDDSNMPPLDAETVAEVEVVEESKEAESATAEQAETPAENVESNEPEEDQGSERFQKRINKVTADKFAEKRRADELARQLEEIQQSTPQTPSTGAPKLEDFDYDESKHQDALIDYKVNLKAQEITQQGQQAQIDQQRAQNQNVFDAKVETFTADAPDYQDVIGRIPPLAQETLDAIVQSEDGPKIAYYLGQHLDIADEIASMPPVLAAMKLGAISAQLSADKPTIKKSAAPDPIEQVTSGGTIS